MNGVWSPHKVLQYSETREDSREEQKCPPICPPDKSKFFKESKQKKLRWWPDLPGGVSFVAKGPSRRACLADPQLSLRPPRSSTALAWLLGPQEPSLPHLWSWKRRMVRRFWWYKADKITNIFHFCIFAHLGQVDRP